MKEWGIGSACFKLAYNGASAILFINAKESFYSSL